MMEQPKEYFAFISYKREDEKWAKWLASELEHYHLPATLNGKDLPKNLRPIFRDVDELSAGNLPKQIYQALSISKNFIVVCSPRSAKSEWVNKEIEDFIKIKGGKSENIYPFIIEGIPFSKDADKECFPEKLRNLPDNEERLGGNINETGGKNVAVVKTIAGMLGVSHDSLWNRYEREQRKKRNWIIATAIIVFLCISGVAFWMYWLEQQAQKANWKMMENQARAVAEKSLELVDDGDSYLARLLLLKILPEDVNREHSNRPYTPEAEGALRTSLKYNNAILRGHSGIINSVAYHPSGEHIVSASDDGTYIVWDSHTGKKQTYYNKTRVYYACYSPDGKYILSVSYDDTLRILNTLTKRATAFPVNDHIRSAVFSPDGKYVYAVSDVGVFYQWNARDGQKKCSLRHKMYARKISISPNGQLIVISGWGRGSIGILETQTGRERKPLIGHRGFVNSATFSPSGKYIVSASSDSTIKIWDAYNGQNVRTLRGHTGGACSAEFSPDEKFIVTASLDSTIRIWDVQSGNELQLLRGHFSEVKSAVFSPDQKSIVSASDDRTVRIWNYQTRQEQQILKKDRTYSFSSMCSPDGKYVAILTDDCELSIKNIQNGKTLYKKNFSIIMRKICPKEDGHIRLCAFNPQSEQVAFNSYNDSHVVLFAYKSGHMTTVSNSYKEMKSVSFSPSGDSVVYSSIDGLAVFDAKTGEMLFPLEHGWIVRHSTYSPNGKYIVSAGEDKKLVIWKAKNGEKQHVLIGHTGKINMSVFSPNNKLLASASDDHSIKLWDVKTGKEKRTLYGHKASVFSVTFSHKGKYIVSTSLDGTIRVWDSVEGIEIKKFDSDRYAYSAVFGGNDKQIISESFSISYDRIVRIWEFPSLQQLIEETRERFNNRKLTPEELRKYYLENI